MSIPRALFIAAAALLATPAAAAPKTEKAPSKATKARPSATTVRKAGPVRRGKAVKVPTTPVTKVPRYYVNVQFVRTADDDGALPSTLTKAKAEAALARLNEVWARNGGDIRFQLHPASNFDSLIRSTLLNQDCTFTAGWNAAKVEQQTDPDLDPETMCQKETHKIARNAYGMARGNRVIVFSRGGREYLKFDGDVGHWIVKKATGGASSYAAHYIRMPPSFGGSTLLAHEMGHYMHAAHPFGHKPKTIADARALMEQWAKDHPGSDPAEIFDRDTRVEFSVHDTPPDPSSGLFKTVYGDACDPDKATITVRNVSVGSTTKTVVLAPDRRNVMSYFKGCPFDHYLSDDQWMRVHEALESGNRKELVTPRAATCYEPGFSPGPPVDTHAKLIALMRKIAACTLLQKEPMPWEIVERDIYVNPADKLTRGVRKLGGIGVNVRKERAFVNKTIAAPMVE